MAAHWSGSEWCAASHCELPTIGILFGPVVLAACCSSTDGTNFVDELMRFQDAVEDATAKAVALPPFLANLLVLGPVKRCRHRTTIALVTILTAACQCAPDSHSRDSGAGGERRAETDALGQ